MRHPRAKSGPLFVDRRPFDQRVERVLVALQEATVEAAMLIEQLTGVQTPQSAEVREAVKRMRATRDREEAKS